MPSSFSAAGPRLRDQGLSVLPILPMGKAPGKYSGGKWYPMHDWSQYSKRLPTKYEIEIWPRWPDAGIGLALGPASAPAGFILVAGDIDTDDATISQAILAALPPSPVRKRGRTGQTGFYLARPCVLNHSFNIGGKRVLDLLADGRQTVLPPTVHPSSQTPYHWITEDTLEDFDVAELPILPDDIVERLTEALRPLGLDEKEAPQLAQPGQASIGAVDSPHRALNELALANLDAWVPALQLFNCTKSGNHYRATAHWRASGSGRALSQRAANLSIAAEGIKDFGATETTYTALDLVMAATGADLDTAFRFLQEKVAPQKPVILTAKAPVEPKRANLAGLIDPNAKPIAELPANDGPAPPDYFPIPEDGVIPEAYCYPPGLLGEIAGFLNDSASTPIPHHNLGSAIVLLGTFLGRRFESPTRARTNFYFMALGGSGAGKDHSMKGARALALSCGLEKFLAAEEAKSDSAIRKMLERFPVAGMFTDEVGGWLGKILDRRAAAHDKRQRDMLLTLFSRANDIYLGSEGATEKAVPIMQPNLSLYGASTPADIWKAFTSASADDGLLPRWLIINAPKGRPAWREPKIDITETPQALRRRLIDLMEIRPKGNLNGVGANLNKPIRAEWGADAMAWWLAYREEKQDQADANERRAPFYNRAAEHCIKLALVLSVGCDPHSPVITVAALEWARMVTECSLTAMFNAMENRIADNDRHGEYLMVKRMIIDAGPRGISKVAAWKAVNGRFDKRRMDEIIAQLKEAAEIEEVVGAGPEGGRPTSRWRRRSADVEEAA